MTTISAFTSIARASLIQKAPTVRPSAILGLPSMTMNPRKVKCSMEGKPEQTKSNLGMGASVLAAACAAAMSSSQGATALVDERMSTEGTGLPFGLSNNLLGWILLGVFCLIWTFYTIYTSGLDEDEDSGLSL